MGQGKAFRAAWGPAGEEELGLGTHTYLDPGQVLIKFSAGPRGLDGSSPTPGCSGGQTGPWLLGLSVISFALYPNAS